MRELARAFPLSINTQVVFRWIFEHWFAVDFAHIAVGCDTYVYLIGKVWPTSEYFVVKQMYQVAVRRFLYVSIFDFVNEVLKAGISREAVVSRQGSHSQCITERFLWPCYRSENASEFILCFYKFELVIAEYHIANVRGKAASNVEEVLVLSEHAGVFRFPFFRVEVRNDKTKSDGVRWIKCPKKVGWFSDFVTTQIGQRAICLATPLIGRTADVLKDTEVHIKFWSRVVHKTWTPTSRKCKEKDYAEPKMTFHCYLPI